MDNGSEKHPVRDSANESMRPGFLGGKGGGETPAEGKINLSREAAANELGNNEAAASNAPSAASGAAGLLKSEAGGGGFFSGTGRNLASGKKMLNKAKILKASAGAGILIAILVVAVLVVGTPIFMIGNLDYNLMQALGFSDTVDILEKQAEYVTGEQLSKGEVPAGYAADLAAAGIQVGQVTVAGDFVPTNRYIANVDELNEIAAVGSGFQVNSAEGELAVLFDNEVIAAADFVAAVESNPKMYMAFTEGADISARYYYSKDVDKVYSDMGLKRWAFHAWEATGDADLDQKNYDEILQSVLDVESSLEGGYDCNDEGTCDGVNLTGDAEDILGDFGDKKNKSAAGLLNSAISSEESYKAASAFMGIEEPLQRTRVEGDGPANEVMTTLNDDSIIVTYTDVNTGEEVEKGVSILETTNFVAAVSGGGYDTAEAANFSRDRVLKVTESGSSMVDDTEVSSSGRKESKIGVGIFSDSTDLDKAESSIQIALSDSNSNLFTSIVGGNRIVEGGAFLSNMINQRVVGAMPSDDEMVAEYSREAKEIATRKAEAERATKSPFDISTPNTFMGSIAHGLADIMIQNHVSKSPIVTAVGAMMSYAGNAMNGLFGNALADGNDESYLDTSGEDCETVGTVGSAADLYCTSKTTIYTGYMSRTEDDWGDTGEKEGYKKFVEDGMARWASVGVEDAEVCKRNQNAVEELLSGLFGACIGVSGDIATGEKYVMNGDNNDVKKYSGYTLYDTVSSLLSEKQSTASMIMEEYYKEHPMDNSRAGIIARRSGMTKQEAEVALAYADYLDVIAKYDASDRYAFGEVELEIPEKSLLEEHSEKINGDLYCFWRGRNEYGDARNRNFVV